jgi:hypothetical protein
MSGRQPRGTNQWTRRWEGAGTGFMSDVFHPLMLLVGFFAALKNPVIFFASLALGFVTVNFARMLLISIAGSFGAAVWLSLQVSGDVRFTAVVGVFFAVFALMLPGYLMRLILRATRRA